MRVIPPQVGRHPMGDIVENKDDDGEEIEIVKHRMLLPKEQRQQTKANANGHEYVVPVTEPAVPLALFYDLVYPMAKHYYALNTSPRILIILILNHIPIPTTKIITIKVITKAHPFATLLSDSESLDGAIECWPSAIFRLL